jgi:hypothetical protein
MSSDPKFIAVSMMMPDFIDRILHTSNHAVPLAHLRLVISVFAILSISSE